MSAFAHLSAAVGERLRELYQSTDATGRRCDVLYYFWVKSLPCPGCAHGVDLFSTRVVARNAYPDRKPEVQICCPRCGDIFPSLSHHTYASCLSCGFDFDPNEGPARAAQAICPACACAFSIAQAVRVAPRFAPGGVVAYIGDTENKFAHLEADYLAGLGVTLDSAAKMPDVIVHHVERNWLLLIEAVTSAGPVDGKRRKDLKELFSGSKAGLVFVTAFDTRRVMQSFLSQIAWESEVWIAEDPAHMIHFSGERFLGPYPDAQPRGSSQFDPAPD
jgi:hypothetical protein